MITRPDHQSGDLKTKLEGLGAEVFGVPVVQIGPPPDLGALQTALKNLPNYDWLVLTSVNGVEAVRLQVEALGLPRNFVAERKLAAIGPATAKAMAEAFRAPDLVPDEFVSEAIASQMPDVRGVKFLLARADLARKDLADTLRSRGAVVDEVAAYRIVRAADVDLPDEAPDAITLTSAEIARATHDMLQRKGKIQWMSETSIICIGPITAAAVRELGFEPAAVAAQYDEPGLITALVELFGKEAAHA
ncbi:MAG: uroporphyrinogen-III synthase [Armatimonadetes bacterium]|nr:uroporphyrinogen-III synthase [Armatimonadota bacterium]